ncbi:MAG: indole-3-glycerol phosphate synthase TrpC [Chlamydiae bacterium]|nr:indole-3-glycerol phosphate synthase TrpC [Chlamydiota bacterium]MBI3277071.1 indole-3-glycerol phosphate synthase TrpC [Chlamydiota bacterium]
MAGTFLEEIIQYKKRKVENAKKIFPLEKIISLISLKNFSKVSSFKKAIQRPPGKALRLIAEVKKASPSKGLLRRDFDPIMIAKIYEKKGASALSVLTDEKFFQGSLENLEIISQNISLPLLRKDFIVDEYQIYEAKAHGASAVLLIVAALEKKEIISFLAKVREIGLSALIEVHEKDELKLALECGADLIGINNRDLKTFQVDLKTCEVLCQDLISGVTTVVESGILTREDVNRVAQLPVDAILVGEAFMTAPDIAMKMRELMREEYSK